MTATICDKDGRFKRKFEVSHINHIEENPWLRQSSLNLSPGDIITISDEPTDETLP